MPRLADIALVNAPLECPNSSDSSSVSGMAAQLTLMNGMWRCALRMCRARATSSFLARAGLARDEHRAARGSHDVDETDDLGDGTAPSDDAVGISRDTGSSPGDRLVIHVHNSCSRFLIPPPPSIIGRPVLPDRPDRTLDYRIMAPTSALSDCNSCGDTAANVGDDAVRSATEIDPSAWLQNTCSTSLTRTVTMMYPRRL